MKKLLFLVALTVISFRPARAAILVDSTACPGGVVTACPSGQTFNTAGGAVTTTTNSFSTTKGEQFLILVGTTGSGFSGSVTASGGSFSYGPVQIATVQHGGTGYTGAFTARSSAALTSVTFSAVNANSSVNHTAILVIPFASPAIIGAYTTNNGSGTVATLTLNNVLNSSMVFTAVADKNSSTARTPAAGSSTILDSTDVTTNSDAWFAVASTPSSTGSVTLGYTAPSVTFNQYSQVSIEVVDSTITTSPDQLACPQASFTLLANCPQAVGTTSPLTTNGFSTIAPVELICVSVAQTGTISTSTSITDSGISKSIGWTRVLQSNRLAVINTELWCAVTSAAVSTQTITATFTGSGSNSTSLKVVPYLYARTSALPTNFVGANGTASPVVSITPAASGSMLQGVFSYSDTNNFPSQTSTPAAWISAIAQGNSVGCSFTEHATSQSTSANIIGITAPSTASWAAGFMEIPVANSAPTGPANSGLFGFWGSLDLRAAPLSAKTLW